MVDLWASAQRLLGKWEGPVTGRPGTGEQVREYRSILQGRFILGTDRTRWVPTPEEPAGLFHEDLAVMGWDAAAGQLRMRGFHTEGFVHDYRCVDAASDSVGARIRRVLCSDTVVLPLRRSRLLDACLLSMHGIVGPSGRPNDHTMSAALAMTSAS